MRIIQVNDLATVILNISSLSDESSKISTRVFLGGGNMLLFGPILATDNSESDDPVGSLDRIEKR